jgi:hypothetical protein
VKILMAAWAADLARVGAIASSLELIRGQTRRPASRDEPTEEAPPSENASDDHCGPRETLAELTAAAWGGVTEFYLALLGPAAPAMPAA